MILFVIFVFFVIFTITDYRKSLFVWATFCIIAHNGLCLKYSSPAITLQLAINLFFGLSFIVKRKKHVINEEVFALKKPMVLLLLSACLSAMFGILEFGRSMITVFGYYVNVFLIIFLLHKEVRTQYDLQKLTKYLYLSISIGVIYGFFTLLIGYNPVILLEQQILPSSAENIVVDSFETYRGVKMQSFYAGATQFCAFVFLSSICYMAVKRNIFNTLTNDVIIIIFIAVVCAFFTKTRAGILASIVSVIYFITTLKSRYYIKAILYVVLLLIIFAPFFSSNIDYLISTFDTKAQENVGGSSIDMRLVQTELTLEILREHPFFGAGVGSLILYLRKFYELYGAESIWFQILIQQGIFGAIAYIYLFYYTFKLISPSMRGYIVMAITFWLTLHTLSTTGLSEYFYLLTFLIIYKKDNFLRNENRNNNISRLR